MGIVNMEIQSNKLYPTKPIFNQFQSANIRHNSSYTQGDKQ